MPVRQFLYPKFQIWEYNAPFRRLLLRSEHAGRSSIDLKFSGVCHINMPKFCPNLEVDEAHAEDFARLDPLSKLAVQDKSNQLFILKTPSRRHYVVAESLDIDEDPGLDIFQSPFVDELPPLPPPSCFQVWEFNVSHARLVIRKPKFGDYGVNIDMKFFGVVALNVPAAFPDLEVVEAKPEDAEQLASGSWEHDSVTRLGDKMFILKCQNHRYYVAACDMRIEESTAGIYEKVLPPIAPSLDID